jgi:deoxyribonuclease IV
MLIGAHVSTAGGLPNAIARGTALGCEAIQIFNQSPRMWRPTAYGDDDIAAFTEAMSASPIRAVVIHAVYLLNCASDEAALRRKSLASLTYSLRLGAAIGSAGVILHPGSAKSGDVRKAIARAGKTIAAALADSERCALALENTAGAGGTLGRSVDELAQLLEAAGAGDRLGICLDSCHLLASGYDVRTRAGVDALLGEVSTKIGAERIRALHLNDSLAPLGSNRDRHANVGEGELGERGCAAFLGARAFDGLACVLETPGEGAGPTAAEVALAAKLRRRGVRARTRAGRGSDARDR